MKLLAAITIFMLTYIFILMACIGCRNWILGRGIKIANKIKQSILDAEEKLNKL